MGRITGPRPGYPDLIHPRELAAAAGISEAHFYRLTSRQEVPETCGGIPRKIATAWLQRRAAAALKRKSAKAKKVSAVAASVASTDGAEARHDAKQPS